MQIFSILGKEKKTGKVLSVACETKVLLHLACFHVVLVSQLQKGHSKTGRGTWIS